MFLRLSDPPDCVTCIQDGQRLTFRGIPAGIQKSLGIGPAEVVTFVELPGDMPDAIRLSDGREINLFEFIRSEHVDQVRVVCGDQLTQLFGPAIRDAQPIAKDLVAA